MKEILLSKKGKNSGKYIALVDDEDFERVNAFNWSLLKSNNKLYAVRQKQVDKKIEAITMHSFIMNRKIVDHVDFNGLNNQKHNLRLCTLSENMMNRRPFVGSSSKYKGVYTNTKGDKYYAQITKSHKQMHLGTFTSEIEAAMEYDKMAKELFGEFAFLNFK